MCRPVLGLGYEQLSRSNPLTIINLLVSKIVKNNPGQLTKSMPGSGQVNYIRYFTISINLKVKKKFTKKLFKTNFFIQMVQSGRLKLDLAHTEFSTKFNKSYVNHK